MIYSDDRPGGILIQSKSRLAFELIECESCGSLMNIDIQAAAQDVTYRPRCESCGTVHAFVRLNGVVIVGVPFDQMLAKSAPQKPNDALTRQLNEAKHHQHDRHLNTYRMTDPNRPH